MELSSPGFKKRRRSSNFKLCWLSVYFGKVSFSLIDQGIKAQLPRAYHLELHPEDEANFDEEAFMQAAAQGKPPLMRFKPVPVVEMGTCTTMVISRLFDNVRSDEIALYRPKPGQSENVIDTARYYPMIYQQDPRHTHRRAPHLIDFICAKVVFGCLVKKGSVSIFGTHAHLLIT